MSQPINHSSGDGLNRRFRRAWPQRATLTERSLSSLAQLWSAAQLRSAACLRSAAQLRSAWIGMGWFLVMLVVPGQLTAQQDAPETRDDSTVLKSIDAVRAAFADQDTQGLAVDVTGNIVLYDPRHTDCFIQHDESVLYVGFPKDQWPDAANFQLGDLVRVTGTMSRANACVDAVSMKRIEAGQTPAPLTTPLAQLGLGEHWGRWVQQYGVVQQATCLGSTTYLGLSDQERYFSVRIATSMPVDTVKSWIGCRVRVTGALVCEHETDKLEYFSVLASSPDQVSVVEHGDHWQEPEAVTIDTLFESSGQEVKFDAAVGHVNRYRRLLLEDGTSAVTVNLPLTSSMYPGERVEVYGCKSGINEVDATLVVKKTFQKLAPPLRMSAGDFIASNQPMRRVEMSGDVLHWDLEGGRVRVHLEDDDIRFYIQFDADQATFEKLRLEQADRIRFQGSAMLLPKNASGEQFRVLVLDSDQVRVELLTAEVRRRRLATIAASILAVGALIGLLRYQVRSRTRQLAYETAWLQASYNAVREGVLLVDGYGKVQRCNFQLLNQFDLSEPPSQFHEIYEWFGATLQSPEEFRDWCGMANGNAQVSLCREFTSAGESPKHFVVHTAPVQLTDRWHKQSHGVSRIWTFDDVTQQRKIEYQLRQSQKLDAIGQLAGGVAHDFNNILATIMSNVELMAHEPQSPVSAHQKKFETVQEAIARASKLTSSLLEYSCETQLDSARVDVNALVCDMVDFVQPIIGSPIELSVQLARVPVYVQADKARLQQVLLNLCLNARDAIDGSGRITLRTFEETIESRKQAAIQVIDNGCGIDQPHIDRVFDPFYTTKPTGQGTGLGLSMAHGIITQHGGTISLESTVGQGTTFTIHLPLATKESCQSAVDQSNVARVPSKPNQSAGTGRRVLLADDEAPLRLALAQLLTSGGFLVDQAENGAQVLEMLGSHSASDYALVLMDVSMPKMTGTEALASLRQSHPHLPVILISGRINTDEFESAACAPNAILHKPVRSSLLFETIERVIC